MQIIVRQTDAGTADLSDQLGGPNDAYELLESKRWRFPIPGYLWKFLSSVPTAAVGSDMGNALPLTLRGEAVLQVTRALLRVFEKDRLQAYSLCPLDVRGMVVHKDRSFSRKPILLQKIFEHRASRLHHLGLARNHDANKSVLKIITLAHMCEHRDRHVGEAVKGHTAFAQRAKYGDRLRLHYERFSHGVQELG